MSVVINTNVDALKIQNLLNSSTNAMSSSMQRMSSGLKILSAKDDAAGSVISARMQVQLNGNKIAQNNVQNGNAMLSSAEGNIDVVLDNVSRIRDLTLQAKNGTYSDDEIQAMQDEVAERVAEIDRVSNSAKYSQLGLFSDTKLQANGVTFQVGANPTENDVIKASSDIFASVQFKDITKFTEIDYDADLKKNPTDDTKIDTNEYKALGTGTEYYKEAEDGKYVEGAIFAVTETGANGKWYVKSEADTDVKANTLFKVADKQIYLDLTSTTDFDAALGKLDDAIDNLTARKSQIGSAQNRLDSALSTLSIQNENLSSANSIITDADIAAEASNFTQQQILQQVSTSLLAQANQAPSVALSLI